MATMETEARGRGMDPALYTAARQGSVEILRKLVVKDVKILNSKTPQGNTALHLAALHGHAKFAREVLAVSEELLVSQNDGGDTPLHLAAKAGRLEVARLLIHRALGWPQDMKGPLIMTNKAGNTALHEAVQSRRVAVAVALLDADPNRGHDLNERMESPLHIAAREGLVLVVQKIVDSPWIGAEFLPAVSLSGTVLDQAALGTRHRIVEILLEKRPDLIDLTDSDGNNALHYAAQKDNQRAVEMLLKKRMELAYRRNHISLSPLHVAAQYGSTDAIKALLRHCPDVSEMADINGRNAFHASVISGKVNPLRCLLGRVRPAELLNRADNNGDTPLHLAAKMSHVHSALMLLDDPRVDPCIRDRDGRTARGLLETNLHTSETDIHDFYLWKQLKKQESKRCHKKQLPPTRFQSKRRPLNEKDFDKVVDAYFLAATLIATVTFASTFTMPGGYDQSKGIALHGNNRVFKTFVISNSVAMCSSIVVVFFLMWARQEPTFEKLNYLVWSQRLTIIACLAMLVSLMTAVYITVAPTAPGPAYTVIAIGICCSCLAFWKTLIVKLL